MMLGIILGFAIDVLDGDAGAIKEVAAPIALTIFKDEENDSINDTQRSSLIRESFRKKKAMMQRSKSTH
jgi:hypothetical protein